MSSGSDSKPLNAESLSLLKHDIKNQLSNIQLALEGLKHACDEPDDREMYLNTLAQSARTIDRLLDGLN